MIRRIRSSLTAKVFLAVAGLLMLTCLIIYGLILLFMPYSYSNTLADELSVELTTLVTTLDGLSYEEALDQISGEEADESSLTYEIEYHSVDIEWADEDVRVVVVPEDEDLPEDLSEGLDDTDVVYIAAEGDDVDDVDIGYGASLFGSDVIVASQVTELDGQFYTVTATASSREVSQAQAVMLDIMPYIFVFILLLSVGAAYLYSRYMTRPIRALSGVARQMSADDLSARSELKRTDEIGILSGSLNDLAGNLDTALQELRQANTTLQEDIDREREQERQRRDFFRAVSHELKTPLTILKGELEGMIHAVGIYRDRDTYLRHSLETTRSMEQLVQEILTISKMEAENFSLNLGPVELDRLVEETLETYGGLARSKNMSVETVLEPLVCRGDKKVLGKALSNLVGNALTYSPEGEQVLVILTTEAGRGLLTIENTGTRISEADLARVFEPFYRVEKSRSRHSGGSGLGLYIVQTILSLHGMDYRMENTEAGVAFTIAFDLDVVPEA